MFTNNLDNKNTKFLLAMAEFKPYLQLVVIFSCRRPPYIGRTSILIYVTVNRAIRGLHNPTKKQYANNYLSFSKSPLQCMFTNNIICYGSYLLIHSVERCSDIFTVTVILLMFSNKITAKENFFLLLPNLNMFRNVFINHWNISKFYLQKPRRFTQFSIHLKSRSVTAPHTNRQLTCRVYTSG